MSKIVFVDGRPVIEEVEKRLVYRSLPAWLNSVTDIFTLLLALTERGIPFQIKSPGTPTNKGALDKWRVKVYADKTYTVEAYTARGIGAAAAGKLRDAEDPKVTITRAVNEDYRKSEVDDLATLVRSLHELEEEIEEDVRRIEREAAHSYDPLVHGEVVE